MSIPPDFRHRALLLHLEREARAAGRGLWRR
jgi:endonuclease YncB( thermonuclease family)